MRIHIGGDHAAFDLQRHLVQWLRVQGHDVVDHGPLTLDPDDDYPVYVLRAATAVAAEPDTLGIVLGGSGNGEQIAANKVPGIRAALCLEPEFAELARKHNGAQVLSLAGRFTSQQEAERIVKVFLGTPVGTEPRHLRRLAMVAAFEADGTLPPLPDAGSTPAH